MKTKNKLITAMGGRDATVTNNNEVFAKQKLQRIILTWMSILFAVALSLMATACKDDPPEDPKKVQPDTTIPLTFTDTPNVTPPPTYSVTITSLDKFTDTEWNTLCDKMVDKIKTACINNSSNRGVFVSSQNTKVVFGNNFTYNWEIKTDEYRTMYIKTSSIDTVNFLHPIACMSTNESYNSSMPI